MQSDQAGIQNRSLGSGINLLIATCESTAKQIGTTEVLKASHIEFVVAPTYNKVEASIFFANKNCLQSLTHVEIIRIALSAGPSARSVVTK